MMNRTTVSLVTLLGVCAPALGQVASALVQEGERLPGGPSDEVVVSINNSATNHAGGYAFNVNTSNGTVTVSRIWGHGGGGAGGIIRSEGTFGALVQTAYESFYGISDTAQVAYSATGTGGPVGNFDSVWRDDDPLAVEGAEVASIPGQFWVFASRPGITADGDPYWVGGFTPVQGGATQNRGLFYGTGATPVLIGGDTPANLPFPLDGAGSPISFDYRYSALGTNYIAEVQMDTVTASDAAMVLNGAGLLLDGALVREGSPVPPAIGGINGENWANFDFCGVTEDGQYLFTGDTSGPTNADEFVLINGQIVYREGQVLDGETVTTDIEGAYMNDDGDVAFIWDIAGAPVREALFLNGRLVLVEGDQVDFDNDGAPDPNSILTDFTGISSLTISDRLEGGVIALYFTADASVDGVVREGGYCMLVIPGDVDGSGCVGQSDLGILLAAFGTCAGDAGYDPAADLDGDECVGQSDLGILLANFGLGCP